MSKKSNKAGKKTGRDEIVGDQKLLDRLKALKRFMEDNWGRIGKKLARVREPEDVKAILKSVPDVQWCTPFTDNYPHTAVCLLRDGNTPVERDELALTRDQHEDAVANESRLRSDYNTLRQRADEATTALRASISQFASGIQTVPFFLVVTLVATHLGVKELTQRANALESAYRLAQKEKERLQNLLSMQESWFARNEIVKFIRSQRVHKDDPFNFAKAMAGLPEYGWLHSFRRCSEINDKSLAERSFNYQLFKYIEEIAKAARPLKLAKIEEQLRYALCREDANPLLRSYFSPHWAWVRLALAECRGKRLNRADLPFEVMAAYLHHFERPKSLGEVELAKRDELVCS